MRLLKSEYVFLDKIKMFYDDNRNYLGDDLRIKGVVKLYE